MSVLTEIQTENVTFAGLPKDYLFSRPCYEIRIKRICIENLQNI